MATPSLLRSRVRLGGLAIVLAVLGAVTAFALGVDLGAIGRRGESPTVIGGSPLLDKPAPDFTLRSLDGREVSLTDYRGRPVIVNFWASWCGPCKEEFPLFADARERHSGEGLEILGIIHDDSAEAAGAFAEERSAAWPMLLDPDDSAWRAYLGVGLPMSFYIDREGIIRAVSFGPPPSRSLDLQIAKII